MTFVSLMVGILSSLKLKERNKKCQETTNKQNTS